MKIFVISSSAIPTPPPIDEYGGLERIAGEFALEAARMGHDVTLISAKGSPLAGEWRFAQNQEKPEEVGILKVRETHIPSWNYGEFQHYMFDNSCACPVDIPTNLGCLTPGGGV